VLKKRLLLAAIGLSLFLLLGAAIACSLVTQRLREPFRSFPIGENYFTVERGATVSQIARKLEAEGFIESAFLFKWYTKLGMEGFSPKTGEYRFGRPLSITQIAEILHDGRIHFYKVTVPEGLDWRETVSIFVRRGFGAREVFEELVWSPSLIADLDPRAENLEGYLYPETYLLPRGTSEQRIIQVMLDNLRRIWTPERQAKAEQLGWSVREVLTLASLIEEETRLESERPLISAVFHNRLRRNMNLACDPTVVYAVKLVKEYDGVIHKSDLEIVSPYNTYLNPGLPPGPIANPGLASIDAALEPADSDFLFFVSKNDGSHYFSSEYRDHRRAVQEYQR